MYNNELEYNNAISAFYVNDKISGYECCKKIFRPGKKISFKKQNK